MINDKNSRYEAVKNIKKFFRRGNGTFSIKDYIFEYIENNYSDENFLFILVITNVETKSGMIDVIVDKEDVVW